MVGVQITLVGFFEVVIVASGARSRWRAGVVEVVTGWFCQLECSFDLELHSQVSWKKNECKL